MNRYCIKCGKEIKLIYEPEKDYPPERCLWEGGVVERIFAGFGSKLDGNEYIITVCDECLTSFGEVC
jgi:hypothetical protein